MGCNAICAANDSGARFMSGWDLARRERAERK